MVGKNNKKLLIERSGTRNPQYGLKKLSVGVVSVAVGAVLSMGATPVHASEIGSVEEVPVEQPIVEETVNEEMKTVSKTGVDEVDGVVEEEIIEDSEETEELEELVDILGSDELITVEENAKSVDNEGFQQEVILESEEILKSTEESTLYDATTEVIEEQDQLVSVEVTEEKDLESITLSEARKAPQLLNTKADLLAPKIIDIYPTRNEFTGDEPRSITVVVEEDNLINSLNIKYVNKDYPVGGWGNPSNFFDFYYSFSNEPVKNEKNQYVLELFNYDIPRYGQHSGGYELDYIYTEDNLGNSHSSYSNDFDSSITYYEYEGQDFTDPILKSVSIDKSVYQAGETVELTIIVEEDKVLNQVSATFRNTGHFGPDYFSLYFHDEYTQDQENGVIKKISDNLFEFTGSLILPKELGPTNYILQSLALNSINLDLELQDFEEIPFEVVNDAVEKVITDYEIEYTTKYEEVTSGKQGIKYQLEDDFEIVISDVVNEVRMYDQADERIPFETIYIENYEMIYQDKIWQQYGEDGYKTVFYDKERNIVEEFTYHHGQNEVIEVGVVEHTYIPFETMYEDDPWKPEGPAWEDVKVYGSEGRVKRVYDLDGNVIEEIVLESPVNQVVVRGALPLTVIPYETEYTYWDYEVREGYNGGKYIYPDGSEYIEYYSSNAVALYEGEHVEIPFEVEYTYHKDYVQDGNNGLMFVHKDGNEDLLHVPTPEVRLYEGESVETPFEIEYTYWDYEVRQGSNGTNFVHADGTEVVISEPWNEIRLREHEIETVPFEIEYRYNYNEYVGYERLVNEGFDGLVRVFYDENGVQVHQSFIRSPNNKVIEIGMLSDALIEERESDPNTTTHITLVDQKSGYILDTLTFQGKYYQARLEEYITQFNQKNKTKIETSSYISTNEDIVRKLINGEYVKTYVNNFVTYISNNSENDLRDVVYPLIPEKINIDYHVKNGVRHANSVVNIYEDNTLLLEVEFDAELYREGYEDDALIARSLKLLENSKYHFIRAEMYNNLIPSRGKEIIGNVFNVFVKEHLQKELVEASYGIDYTNDPNQVQSGKNGTKYIYTDGTERSVVSPINEVRLSENTLGEKPIIEEIRVDKDEYAIGETIEVAVSGISGVDIDSLFIDFYDYSKMKMHVIRASLYDGGLARENGRFNAVLKVNTSDFYRNSNFEFRVGTIKDKNNNETVYTVGEDFSVSFKVTDNTLLGTEPIPFETQYTTYEDEVREGQMGSKWVYSNGSEIILEDAIAEIVMHGRELKDIDFETKYTVYTHEVRAGIKGSKFVYENGVEMVIDIPVSAVALYENKVEEFEFTTVKVESSGLAIGETQVLQEGHNGRRVVFYDAKGEVVDRLVVSNPVSHIVQIGANKEMIELTPYETSYTTDPNKVQAGQNGVKYVYADGTEKVIKRAVKAVNLYRYADEVVEFKEVVQENAALTKGLTRVIAEGTSGLKRVFYNADDEVVEERVTLEAINRLTEIGTLVVAEEEDEEVGNLEPNIPGEEIEPETGKDLKEETPEKELETDIGDDGVKDETENEASDENEDTGELDPDVPGEEIEPETDDDLKEVTPDEELETDIGDDDVKDEPENDASDDNEGTGELGPDVSGEEIEPETGDDSKEAIPEEGKSDKDLNPNVERENEETLIPAKPEVESDEGGESVPSDTDSVPVAAANLLPDTGERYGYLWLTVAAVSLFAGLGLVVVGKKKAEN